MTNKKVSYHAVHPSDPAYPQFRAMQEASAEYNRRKAVLDTTYAADIQALNDEFMARWKEIRVTAYSNYTDVPTYVDDHGKMAMVMEFFEDTGVGFIVEVMDPTDEPVNPLMDMAPIGGVN